MPTAKKRKLKKHHWKKYLYSSMLKGISFSLTVISLQPQIMSFIVPFHEHERHTLLVCCFVLFCFFFHYFPSFSRVLLVLLLSFLLNLNSMFSSQEHLFPTDPYSTFQVESVCVAVHSYRIMAN